MNYKDIPGISYSTSYTYQPYQPIAGHGFTYLTTSTEQQLDAIDKVVDSMESFPEVAEMLQAIFK